MHQFSFDFRDPVFDVDGWRLSCQVISFENTYGLPSTAEVSRDGAATMVDATQLTWAGGQRTAPGAARLDARRTDDGIEVSVAATMPGASAARSSSSAAWPAASCWAIDGRASR